MDIKKILVVIEPDAEQQPALAKARTVASSAGAELELLLADFNPFLEDGFYFDPPQARKLRYEHGEKRLSELESLAEPLRSEGLKVSASTAWGNPPHKELVSRIGDFAPDLVIASTRHHNKVARLFLANEDWELVRYCPAPLLLVKGKVDSRATAVIAAVDPNHAHDKPAALDHKIIGAARAMATLSDASVHLFHSAWVPPLSGVYPLVVNQEEESEKLFGLADRHEIAHDNCHSSNEQITESLPELVAELKAGIVVMGAVSRSRFDRVLIGNTAEKLLDHLESDVLVIKPDEMPALSQYLL